MHINLGQLFAQQVHVAELKPLLLKNLSKEGQRYILDQLEASGASPKYRYRILKLIDASTDLLIDDISDAYAEALVASMHPRAAAHDSRSLVIYRWADDKIEINEERDVLVQSGGTGYRTWEAALALGEFFIGRSEVVAGLKQAQTIELGAGTGFVSMVLGKLGVNCIATDGDEEILDRMDADLPKDYLDWGSKTEYTNCNVVAADVLYDPSIFPVFFATVKALLGPDTRAYVATTLRNPETYAHLPAECDKQSLKYRKVAFIDESQWFYLGSSVVEIIEITL